MPLNSRSEPPPPKPTPPPPTVGGLKKFHCLQQGTSKRDRLLSLCCPERGLHSTVLVTVALQQPSLRRSGAGGTEAVTCPSKFGGAADRLDGWGGGEQAEGGKVSRREGTGAGLVQEGGPWYEAGCPYHRRATGRGDRPRRTEQGRPGGEGTGKGPTLAPLDPHPHFSPSLAASSPEAVHLYNPHLRLAHLNCPNFAAGSHSGSAL